MNDDEMILRSIRVLDQRVAVLRRDNARLAMENGSKAHLIEIQAAKIEEDAPKVEFHDNVAASDFTYDLGEAATMLASHGFDIGRTRLIELATKDYRMLVKTKNGYRASQHAADNGWVQTVASPGSKSVKAVFTHKGIQAVTEKLVSLRPLRRWFR
jgi:phage antirepressor YoqD-like protein